MSAPVQFHTTALKSFHTTELQGGWTPLIVSASLGHGAAIKALLVGGAAADLAMPVQRPPLCAVNSVDCVLV